MNMGKTETARLVEYIFESGALCHTPRSGLWHLGMGNQSVAEHSFRVAAIGYMLAHAIPEADPRVVLEMCLFHDFHEARTSDMNHLHKKYSETDEDRAVSDAFESLPASDEMRALMSERSKQESLEARIAKDADILEWIAFLVEQKWNGSLKADYWLSRATKKLSMEISKEIESEILSANPDDWWKRTIG